MSLHNVIDAWWHGLVIAAVAGACLRSPFVPSAATRYLVWWAALVAVAIDAVRVLAAPLTDAVSAPAAGPSPASLLPLALPSAPPVLDLAAATIWLVVACGLTARIIHGYRRMTMLRRRTTVWPARDARRLERLRGLRTGARIARVRTSNEVSGAVVLGGRRPLIVVASRLLSGLSSDDLDRVLLHEQNHVDRRDDWSKLAQACVQAVLWCHPAVWIIGRALDVERESACDDRVVACTGSARAYAHCLVRVSELLAAPEPSLATASMIGVTSELTRRIHRLLDARRPRALDVSWARVTAAGGMMTASAAALGLCAPLIGVRIDDGQPAAVRDAGALVAVAIQTPAPVALAAVARAGREFSNASAGASRPRRDVRPAFAAQDLHSTPGPERVVDTSSEPAPSEPIISSPLRASTIAGLESAAIGFPSPVTASHVSATAEDALEEMPPTLTDVGKGAQHVSTRAVQAGVRGYHAASGFLARSGVRTGTFVSKMGAAIRDAANP